MATLAELVVKVRGDVADFVSQMNAVDQRMKKVGDNLKNLGTRLTTAISLPLVGVGVEAGKMAISFDDAMRKVVGLAGVAQSQVDEWRDDIMAMAGEVGRPPQELADALYSVTSAGFRGKEALDVLRAAGMAATAGLGETRDVTMAVTGALNAYGMDVLSASQATDVLAATARAGNFETSELAGALGRVTPFAAAAGVSFADVGGAIALLTRSNNDAAMSVDQLAALLRAFSAPTKQTIDALAQLGLTTDQVRQSMADQGLAATLQMLDQRLNGNRDALRNIIPDSMGFAAALTILNADSQTLSDTFGVVQNSTGLTAQAFDAAASGPGFQMRQAMAQINDVLIQLGSQVLPLVTPVIERLSDAISRVVQWFSNLDPHTKALIETLGLILVAVGPVLVILGTLVSAIGALISPIGLVMVAIVALTAAWALWGDDIKRIIGEAVGWISDELHTFAGWLSGIWDGIKQAATNVWTGIKDAILGVWRGIVDGINGFINRIIDALNGMIRALNRVHFTVPDWVPVIGGMSWGFHLPDIPHLATGGIITRPTLALVGEAGPEAVVPLGRGGMAAAGLGGITLNIYGSVGVDDIAERLVSEIRRRTGIRL